jgi:hypothetical protein
LATASMPMLPSAPSAHNDRCRALGTTGCGATGIVIRAHRGGFRFMQGADDHAYAWPACAVRIAFRVIGLTG